VTSFNQLMVTTGILVAYPGTMASRATPDDLFTRPLRNVSNSSAGECRPLISGRHDWPRAERRTATIMTPLKWDGDVHLRHLLMACELREVLGEPPPGTGVPFTAGGVGPDLGADRGSTTRAASPGSACARVSIG
jgi:hypothetical protein